MIGALLEVISGFFSKVTFIDFIFFPFAGFTFFAYYIVPLRVRKYVLLFASIAFYATWGITQFAFVLLAAFISYGGALAIERAGTRGRKKMVLFPSLALIVSMLLYVKIGKLFLTSKSIIIPLGISYYTFSIIGYLADVYWGKEKAERNFLRFLLFILYFPKILEGPIEKFRPLSDRLWDGHRFDYKQFCFGLQLMVYGAFKKLVIADRISVLTGKIFSVERLGDYGGAMVVLGAALRALQMYADFSGCMDMALGMSECMGIELTPNFRHPFFSKSAAEFWRRWHITLGIWFKDYIYMPLVVNPRLIRISGFFRKKVGKRAGKAVMTVAPLYVVWILTGLWHGTGKGYVAWGLYYGTIIVFSTVFDPELKKLAKLLRINTESASYNIFRVARTFLIFSFGRLLTVEHFRDQLKKILFDFRPWQLFDGTLFGMGLDRPNFAVLVIALCVLWRISLAQEKGSLREIVAGLNIVFRWILYLGAVFAVLIFGMYGPGFNASDFAYMQF